MCLFASTAHHPEVIDGAGKLAEFAIANIDGAIAKGQEPSNRLGSTQWIMGIVEYRRGNYAAALDWCQKGVSGMKHDARLAATASLFAAMAAHQLGKAEAARQWLAEAHRLIGTIGAKNTDWLMMDLVRREAEALIAGNAADRKK